VPCGLAGALLDEGTSGMSYDLSLFTSFTNIGLTSREDIEFLRRNVFECIGVPIAD
jgi:hypothetical protein